MYSFCVLDSKSGTSAVNTNNSAVHPDILNNWTSLIGKNIKVRDSVDQDWRIATLVGVADGVVFASLAGNAGLAFRWSFAQPADNKRYVVWEDLADSRVVPCRAKNGDKNDNTGWQEGVLVRVILGHEYPWVVRINGTLAHFQHCQVRRAVNADAGV